jgi:serine/threonine-protein kinase
MAERPDSPKPNFIGMPHGEMYRGGRIGRYEILTQLSVGGMAELFLAFHSGPGGFRKFVVIKRILPDARANENYVKMFFDEARVTAALNHPNIAQVFDLGDDNGPYLAMEFIAGQNLNQVSAACLKKKRTLPIGFSMTVCRDLCLALHHAHTFVDPAGKPFPIIHRDVAQKNVMVTYDGVVKLLDFGIAKSHNSLGRTSVGMVKGTTGYMSPEQVRGEALDGRSDLFSAGVMLHEMLTGRRLFAANTEAEEMERILYAPIPRPVELDSHIPQRISDVVMQALARNRNERFANARAMAKAVEAAAGRLLYDQDQLTTLMRELFERKMSATQALLESAGGEVSRGRVQSAASALTEDSGMTFPEGGSPHPTGPITLPPSNPFAASELAEETTVAGHGPGSPIRHRSNTAWVVGLLVAVLVVGVGLYVLLERSSLLTGGADARDEVHTVAGVTPGAVVTEEKVDERVPARFRLKRGSLTLVTRPEAEVYGGNRLLGGTPLFNFPMDAGVHRVRVKGPDGVFRILTVPIQVGRNTAYRIGLDDLPQE